MVNNEKNKVHIGMIGHVDGTKTELQKAIMKYIGENKILADVEPKEEISTLEQPMIRKRVHHHKRKK